MDAAVPANLRCGRPAAAATTTADANWAPLAFTFAGVWEIEPHWVEEHRAALQILDVREPEEYEGPLGRIPGSRLIPLGSLAERAAELDRDAPIVAVCRAGGRSARATSILAAAGFTRVANLAGGMLRWRAQRLSVEGGAD
jgi:sulfur dioxygenase